jgi:methyl-accepting chemotaxis protein
LHQKNNANQIMKNWTIGKRLTFGFSLLLIVIVTLGIVNWIKMAGIGRNIDSITDQGLPQLASAGNLRYEVTLLRIANLRYLMFTNAAQKQEIETQIESSETNLAAAVAQYQTRISTEQERTIFAKIPSLLDAYRSETKKMREADDLGKSEETQALLASGGKIGAEFVAITDDLQQGCSKSVAQQGTSIRASVVSSKLTTLGAIGLAIILGLGVASFITRDTTRLLGNLAHNLGEGSNQVAAAAGQVSDSSQSLAEGASEQAASLEETSSSLEEMASMTKRNAENAQKANDLAKQARTAADKGTIDMQAMSAAMEAIKASSDDIAKIIKTIDEIAFQTNILALNAAVEAARAGEAGMGFAVVADEVRNLAQRSAQAAKETAGKIEGAITKTGQGVGISQKVAETLNEIVTKARQVDELVAEVASASREQTQGITQINTAVGQMDKVTQSNAANAEESAAAAEELNAQATVMKESVMELLRLVGGTNQQGTIAKTSAASPRAKEIRMAAPMAKRSTTIHGNGHDHATTTTSSVANGRKEIPLEGDFKDF